MCRHCEHGSRHLRLVRVVITCGDKYIILTEGEIGLDEKEASEMTQTFTTRFYSRWEKKVVPLFYYFIIIVQYVFKVMSSLLEAEFPQT